MPYDNAEAKAKFVASQAGGKPPMAPDDEGGDKVTCPKCGAKFVPGDDEDKAETE